MKAKFEDGYQYKHNQTRRLHLPTRQIISQIDSGCHVPHRTLMTSRQESLSCPAWRCADSDTNSILHPCKQQQLLCTPTPRVYQAPW